MSVCVASRLVNCASWQACWVRGDGKVTGEMAGEMTGEIKIEESLYLKGFQLSDGRDEHFFINLT